MAYSIYEIDESQDIAKPSDLLGENYYLQDVFLQTRPEVFNFNDNSTENNDSEVNPYFRERDRDEEQKGEMYFDEFLYNKNPSNFENKDDYLVKKSDKVSRVVSEYLIENNPIEIKLFEKENKKTAVSIAELVRSTSDYSKKYVKGVNVKFLFADRKNIKYYFRAKGFEPWSSNRFHNVILKFEKNPKIKDLRAMDVKISCDCPFWQYQGPDFNAQKEKYLEGDPKSRGEPVDRSSLSKNKICKHVAAVREHIDSWLIRSNLDTYREVGTIIENLQKIKDSFGVESALLAVTDIFDRLKTSDQKELKNLIKITEKEKLDRAKNNKFLQLLEKLKSVLDYQEKNFLSKIISDFRNLLVVLRKQQEKKLKEEKELIKEKREEKKKKEEENKKDKNLNRRQKTLKKILKKSSEYDFKFSNVLRIYQEETGD